MSGKLITSMRGHFAHNPIASPHQLAEFVRDQCGADGYRIEGDILLALRWDLQGNEVIVDRYKLEGVSG